MVGVTGKMDSQFFVSVRGDEVVSEILHGNLICWKLKLEGQIPAGVISLKFQTVIHREIVYTF